MSLMHLMHLMCSLRCIAMVMRCGYSDHFLRRRLSFSLQQPMRVGSRRVAAMSSRASRSLRSAARSMASLYLPMRCRSRYCSSFFLAGMRAIIFIAQVVSPLFSSRSAISSAGILNSFCRFSMKISSSSNFFPSISTLIRSRISRFASTSQLFLKSSTAPPSPLFMKNSICLPRVSGMFLSVTNLTAGFWVMNWLRLSKVLRKASLRHSAWSGEAQASRYWPTVRRNFCMTSYFLAARPMRMNSMILVSVSWRQSQYLTRRSELNILQQLMRAQMHSMFLEKSSKTSQSDSFSEAEMRLIARQSRFSSRDFSASSMLFWQNLWHVSRFSRLPIHSSSGTFLEREGSNSSSFMASSLRPISMERCAISVKETPFSFCSLARMLSQISSSLCSPFCTRQHAQSVKIFTRKFWSFLRQPQTSKARQCSWQRSSIFSSCSSPISRSCSYVMNRSRCRSRWQIRSSFAVSQMSLLLTMFGGRNAFPQVAAFISSVTRSKLSSKRADARHCSTARLSLSLSLRIWSSCSGSSSSKAAQAARRRAPGSSEKHSQTLVQAGGSSRRILLSLRERMRVPSSSSLSSDHFSFSPRCFSMQTYSPLVETRQSSWFWNWRTRARLPHHCMSSGCWCRFRCVPSRTCGSSTTLNLLPSSASELIAGAMITRQAKAQGTGGGSRSPFCFFFCGIMSAGFSLKSGSAAKQARSLLLGERPEMNLSALRCGSLFSARCPPRSWLQKVRLTSFSTTCTTPAEGCTRCSSTFSEMMDRGENTRQKSACWFASASRSSCSTLANSTSCGWNTVRAKRKRRMEVSTASPLSKTLPRRTSSPSSNPSSPRRLISAVCGLMIQSSPFWKTPSRYSSRMKWSATITFWKGLARRMRCTISPSFEKMQMFSSEGSSSRSVRILVLSEVTAICPPKEATAISMYSWLSRLNRFPKLFSENPSHLQRYLLLGKSYQSQSIISDYLSHHAVIAPAAGVPLAFRPESLGQYRYYGKLPGVDRVQIQNLMGNNPPPAKKPTLEDTMIEMKMASKRMGRESSKSMKESQQYMKKAKEALKKNNEEGAKLYLQSAASKRAESMNIQRMGLKMEFICSNMKSMQNNQAIMGSFEKMTTMLNYGNNSPNFEVMSNNLQNFEKTMDEMLINGKMMEELMNNQNGIVDSTADDMLAVLKGELAMETSNQVNEAALIKQKEMEFQEDLKKL